MSKRAQKRPFIAGSIAAVAAAVAFVASGLASQIEHWSTDFQIAYLSRRLPAQHPSIALVLITESTLKSFPYTQPIDRSLLTALITRLEDLGAAVIGLDFIFDRPTEDAKDRQLLEAIRGSTKRIVLGALDDRTSIPSENLAYQSAFLKKANRPVGHLYFEEQQNPFLLNNRIVRLVAQTAEGGFAKRSFAETLAHEFGQSNTFQTRYISWLLPPANGSDTFMTLPADIVLANDQIPWVSLISGKIVIVASGFADSDRHLTPLSLLNSERQLGAFIHAQMVAQLLDRRSIRTLSPPLEIIIFAVAACLGVWLGRKDAIGHSRLWVRSAGTLALIAIGALTFASLDTIFPITITLMFLLVGTTFGHYSRRVI